MAKIPSGQEPPADPRDHKFYLSLRELVSSLTNAPGWEGSTMSNTVMGEEFVRFFQVYGVNPEEFFPHVGISAQLVRNMAKGSFQLSAAQSLLGAIDEHGRDWIRPGYQTPGRWIDVQGDEAQKVISGVSGALSQLYELVAKSNELGDEDSLLNPIEKAQLIAMLEAMLAILKAPAIPEGFVQNTWRWIKEILRRAISKQASETVTDALDAAQGSLGELASQMGDLPGVQSLPDIDKLPLG